MGYGLWTICLYNIKCNNRSVAFDLENEKRKTENKMKSKAFCRRWRRRQMYIVYVAVVAHVPVLRVQSLSLWTASQCRVQADAWPGLAGPEMSCACIVHNTISK